MLEIIKHSWLQGQWEDQNQDGWITLMDTRKLCIRMWYRSTWIERLEVTPVGSHIQLIEHGLLWWCSKDLAGSGKIWKFPHISLQLTKRMPLLWYLLCIERTSWCLFYQKTAHVCHYTKMCETLFRNNSHCVTNICFWGFINWEILFCLLNQCESQLVTRSLCCKQHGSIYINL